MKQKLSIFLLACFVMFFQGVAAADSDSYLMKMLFTPSAGSLQAEANGRIMIYDSLLDETVELAMSEQFDRIENMMFIRTQYLADDGEVEVIDDGC